MAETGLSQPTSFADHFEAPYQGSLERFVRQERLEFRAFADSNDEIPLLTDTEQVYSIVL